MQTRQTRFLPKAVAFELRRVPLRLAGFVLVLLAGCCWLALMSWSFADPSPNYATLSPPQNWLGRRGAGVADNLMQAFGLAAPILIFPLAALGFHLASGATPLRLRRRLGYWLAALLTFPGFFACFATPTRWVLNTGLGGIVGDFVAKRAAHLASALPAPFLWPTIAIIFLLIAGWCLLRACGVVLTDFIGAFGPAPAADSDSVTFDDPFSPRAGDRATSRSTSWAQRMTGRNRALVPRAERSRDLRQFWSRKGHLTERKRPAKSVGSPFANWGGHSAEAAASPLLDDAAEDTFDSGADIFDDVRIEPFFGPRPRSHSSRNGSSADPRSDAPVSPFRRLTGRAAQMAGNRAKRLLDTAASARSRRTARRSLSMEEAHEQRTAFDASLPPVSLLAPPPRKLHRQNPNDPALAQRAAGLLEVLSDFGIRGKITGIFPGPIITLFELEPERGTKSSRIIGLADDIARAMSAVSARISVAPGRNAIAIELPNARREIVSFRALIESRAFRETSAALPLALGQTIGGEPIVTDLARMPHLLIAGATGSGKSVAMHGMILSLLYRLPPSQCHFIMIDPKMLELSVYDGIPHLIAPVVIDPREALTALKWTVREMNSRYERMSKLGVRNIASYNAKAATAQLCGQPLIRVVQTGFDPRTDEPILEEEALDPAPMPYIVVVIDELADLMMVAGKEIESVIQRLSQMARAAGIHLIVATQRPSVDVVTGAIKANFPTRISFRVSSKVDSRTIIGEQGAEQLLGAGDMLHMAAGGRIGRAHGPFVSDDEVEAVVRHLKAEGRSAYRADILGEHGSFSSETTWDAHKFSERDLYADAIEIVLKDRRPTPAYLGRALGISADYAEALIKRMDEDGILSASNRTAWDLGIDANA